MGGKQKRAAKYKKWMEAQNLLRQRKESSLLNDTSLGVPRHDGSGDGPSDSQPIPYQVQQEVLRYRARKAKKFRNTHWVLRKLRHVVSTFEQWPAWPFKLFLGLAASICTFIFLRSVIQMFVPPEAAAVDRAAMYNGLRNALPRPLYKFFRIVDYLFTSPRISFQAINIILNPPEDYVRHYATNR